MRISDLFVVYDARYDIFWADEYGLNLPPWAFRIPILLAKGVDLTWT